jgi:hypothetical protein
MSNILDIHIHRKAAGNTIPFDKLYLVRKEDRELIPKIFGYALVLPFNDELRTALANLKPSFITKKHFRRNDDDKDVSIFGSKRESAHTVHAWWDTFFTEHDVANRVVVIPVLTSTVRKHIKPRYLVAKKWEETQKKKNKRLPQAPVLLSEYAYLATPLAAPDDKIRPICNICPRHLLHVQGECMPGQKVCYSSLDFSEIVQVPNASV